MSNTVNMNLVSPTVGTTTGPTWAENLNSDLSIIDVHDHSPGKGVPITPDGMSITGDLAFNSHNITGARSLRLSAITLGSLVAADVGCLIESGVDLYYVDGNGNQIRITQSGGIAGTSGSISGLTSPASASYSAGSSTFTFQSASNTAAILDVASIVVRKTSASSSGITITAPVALASNYSLTLLAAPPAATNALFMDSSGNLSAPTTPTFLGGLTVGGSGPTLTNSASGVLASSGASLRLGGSGNAYLQGLGTVDTLYVANSNTAAYYPVVVSANPSISGLKIVRGAVSLTGAPVYGEGYSCVRTSTGQYTITFTTAFADVPVVVGSPGNVTFTLAATGTTTSTATIFTGNGGVFANQDFNFIAIGQRA